MQRRGGSARDSVSQRKKTPGDIPITLACINGIALISGQIYNSLVLHPDIFMLNICCWSSIATSLVYSMLLNKYNGRNLQNWQSWSSRHWVHRPQVEWNASCTRRLSTLEDRIHPPSLYSEAIPVQCTATCPKIPECKAAAFDNGAFSTVLQTCPP